MGFKRGESVRVARDLYPDEGSRSFVGRVGRVTGVSENTVTVNGLGDLDQPHESKSWGFDVQEIEKA
jgi:hypothetical protein